MGTRGCSWSSASPLRSTRSPRAPASAGSLSGAVRAIALAWAIRAIGPDAPLRMQTARSFTLLAELLEHELARDVGAAPRTPATADGYTPSRETRVRTAIAEARLLTIEARRREGGPSGCVLGETRPGRAGAAPSGAADDDARAAACRALLTTGARAVARLIARHGAEATSGIEKDLRRLGTGRTTRAPGC